MATGAMKVRYGIGEWFGRDVTGLNRVQRGANLALAQNKSTLTAACPFAAALNPQATCSKPGGVCTIRKYEQRGKGAVANSDQPVTVCPQRFLQGAKLLLWAAKVMLGTDHPLLIKEIPFLAKLTKNSTQPAEDSKKAGRIDWVLVHPDKKNSLRWCAVETQAVYFSGLAMGSEFQSWADAKVGAIPYPTEVRRPDYRSSGPKRLAPQLRVKVPELRNWGAKTAVIVDEYFFAQMSDLQEQVGEPADQLANAEVVWLVARYERGELVPGRVLYARLEDSIRALNATRPVGKLAFEEEIRRLLSDPKKLGKRVFKL